MIYKSIFSFSPGWRDLGNLVNLIFPLSVLLILISHARQRESCAAAGGLPGEGG